MTKLLNNKNNCLNSCLILVMSISSQEALSMPCIHLEPHLKTSVERKDFCPLRTQEYFMSEVVFSVFWCISVWARQNILNAYLLSSSDSFINRMDMDR